ncbi:hypothetical protein GGI07_005086 [Coemansia sp. Benny D115]|nr:hypothetical protein GGI07_005086 [Coemansia sp. Benny D115]
MNQDHSQPAANTARSFKDSDLSRLSRAASANASMLSSTSQDDAPAGPVDPSHGSPTRSFPYGGWAGQTMMGVGAGAGTPGLAVASPNPVHRSVSRRSSVVSTASASFFDRSFFSTPESRITEHSKKTTLAYATLMLNIYNNISLDLKTATEANRRIVVQTVASKSKAVSLEPDLSRVQADVEDAIDTTASISSIPEFESIRELLCHSLQVYEDIKRTNEECE